MSAAIPRKWPQGVIKLSHHARAAPRLRSQFSRSDGGARLRFRAVSARVIVGSSSPGVRDLHRPACRNLSNLRTLVALPLDCTDRAPPVPDLPQDPRAASLPAFLRLPVLRRVLGTRPTRPPAA